MIDRRERILAILNYLQTMLFQERKSECVEIACCGYGIPETFPESGIEWESFDSDSTWGGSDSIFFSVPWYLEERGKLSR